MYWAVLKVVIKRKIKENEPPPKAVFLYFAPLKSIKKEELGMSTAINLFNGPIGSWQRGWFSFYFDQVELSEVGERYLKGVLNKHSDIEPAIIIDLVKYLTVAGFMEGAEDVPVPYDGSRIDQASINAYRVTREKKRGLVVRDLTELRSKNRLTVAEGLALIDEFLKDNKAIFSGFPHGKSFWQDYPFGIIRAEGLFSMFDIEEMDMEGYLDFLSLNFKEKYGIFGGYFWDAHKTTGFPIDHDRKRNVFKAKGPAKFIGKVNVDGEEKNIYLRVNPGNGEGYAGIAFNIVADTPTTNLFDVAFYLVKEKGVVHPRIVKIQRMPLQLNKNLEYQDGFVPHEMFPTRKKLAKLQNAVADLLEGDVFGNLLMAVIGYYQARNFSLISGITGAKNKWLLYHADEVVNCEKEGEEKALQRALNMYDQRFAKLGLEQNGRIWHSSLMNGDYCRLLNNALNSEKIDQGEIIKIKCPNGRIKKVTLPKFRSLVSERGLARLVEHLRDLIDFPEVDDKMFTDAAHLFRTKRKKDLARVELAKEAVIYDHKYPQGKTALI
ncbi:MAG: hypothetical protein ACOCVY_00645 [Patescibacteria group bacterium]